MIPPFNVEARLKVQIKRLIFFLMLGLVISGLTAFPIEWELSLANRWVQDLHWDNIVAKWIGLTYKGTSETNMHYPFISYGTDWLGFAHVVIAISFVGPWRDPLKNKWVIEFGIVACLSIFPFAFIAGAARSIPIFWRFIDCTFGIVGGLILWRCYTKIKLLEKITSMKS